MDRTRDWVWDIETYKHAFTFSIVRADGKFKKTFEVSARMNEVDRILTCLDYLHDNEHRLVGFNSCGFDYPIVHKLIENRDALPKTGKALAAKVFHWAQQQIDSFKNDGFGYTVKTADQYVKQVDLYRIWHFNNKAKATGLKMLEFNMRLDNIEDLPYGIEEELTDEMLDKIKSYNEHDVACTLAFYNTSESQIDFRDNLSIKLDRDFTNADDTKIGAEYFQMELEKAGVSLHTHKDGKRVIKQTKRDKIAIKDCLFNYYNFTQPEFQAVYDWFNKQVITETKGVFSDIEEHDLGEVAKYAELEIKRKKFKLKPTEAEVKLFIKEHPLGWIEEEELKATEYLFDAEGLHVMEYPLDADGSPDFTKKQKKARVPKKSYWGCYRIAATLNVLVNGYRIDFGVGGVHASLSERIVKETKSYMLRDADVSSMYPNVAISNRIYPEHLGEKFCDIYQDMYEQRKSYAKNTAENAMLKLALNGTYGKSNDKYSVFYDPKFTMSITINGQLSLLMLADRLLHIEGLKLVQLNTDGLTVAMLRSTEDQYKEICAQWQKDVKLELEFVDYSKMIIRDVNNYIAVYTNGKTKRKGAYQYEGLGWHQNQSALVIPMAAEASMTTGVDVREFIKQHFEAGNIFDFMLRTKVPRSSKLVLEFEDGRVLEQQRICRYYPCVSGGKLIKLMPALPDSEDKSDRRLGIDTAWNVKTCNNMQDFAGDIDFEYYVQEAQKLIIGG
jgi:DNA polymerase elongation subunit (family B)